jgi:ribosomal-protein-alanine N-acetyltransferase
LNHNTTSPEPVARTLELGAVRLRPLCPADAAPLFDHLRDPRVTVQTSFPEVTPALAEAMVARATARWAAREPGRWALARVDDDRLIGTCGFNDYSRDHRFAELAYDLAPEFWGRGLMSQAVAAAVRWAFDEDVVDRIQAFVRVDNARSVHVLARAGFTREGCLRAFRLCRGQRFDFFLYGRLRADAPDAGGGTPG